MNAACPGTSAEYRLKREFISWDCHGCHAGRRPSSGASGTMPNMWRAIFPRNAHIRRTDRRPSAQLTTDLKIDEGNSNRHWPIEAVCLFPCLSPGGASPSPTDAGATLTKIAETVLSSIIRPAAWIRLQGAAHDAHPRSQVQHQRHLS